MRKSVALSINPGVLYYDFNALKARDEIGNFHGQVLEIDGAIFLTSQDFRLYLSKYGEVKIYLDFDEDNISPWNILVSAFNKIIPKVFSMITSIQKNKIRNIKVFWPSGIRYDDLESDRTKAQFSSIFENRYDIYTDCFETGDCYTSIDSNISIDLNYA